MQTTMMMRRSTTDAMPVESRTNSAASVNIESAIAVVTIQGDIEGEGEQVAPALVCFRCRRVYLGKTDTGKTDAPIWCDCGETLSRLPTALFDSVPPVVQIDPPVPSWPCTQPLTSIERIQNDHVAPPAVVSEAITSSDDTSPYTPTFHAAPPPPPIEVIRRYRAEIRKKYVVMLCCVLLAIAIWLNLILVHWR